MGSVAREVRDLWQRRKACKIDPTTCPRVVTFGRFGVVRFSSQPENPAALANVSVRRTFGAGRTSRLQIIRGE